jgi:hypothetical protein
MHQLSRPCRRLAVATAITTIGALIVASPVWAQIVPDGALITQVLGWLKYAAIAASVAGLLIGGISTGVGHFGSNYSASAAGKKWVLGGIGAAMIAGLAHAIATTVYNAT